jgi:hypothetical protein
MQVDDMNTVTLGIDVWSHCWVPLTLQVTEMTACLQQLVKICSCHFLFSFLIVYFIFNSFLESAGG